MKSYKYSIAKLLFCCTIALFSGCSQGEKIENDELKDDAVSLEFSLPTSVTKADATTDLMAIGNAFQVFVFKEGAAVTVTPEAIETYTVVDGNKATGNIKLFRGGYDLYFASYNSAGQTPQLAFNGAITVGNGKDFMISSLKGVSVQPTGGAALQTISLNKPFNRMGTEVTLQVKAADKQPVAVQSMKVNYVTIKKLSTDLSWKLGAEVWDVVDQQFNQEQTFTEFTQVGQSNVYESKPKVLLPTSGVQPLEFIINMTVNGTEKNYEATLLKPLLQGMAYNFVFTLTFYGNIVPTDLTLVVKEYNSIDLKTDAVGGDK